MYFQLVLSSFQDDINGGVVGLSDFRVCHTKAAKRWFGGKDTDIHDWNTTWSSRRWLTVGVTQTVWSSRKVLLLRRRAALEAKSLLCSPAMFLLELKS
jgi:hypothetical protein